MPDSCADALKLGVFDEVWSKTSEFHSYVYAYRLSHMTYSEYKEKFSAGAEVVIYDTPVNGDMNQDEFRKYQEEINKSINFDIFDSYQTEFYSRIASKTVYDAWLKCMEIKNKLPVEITLERSGGEGIAELTLFSNDDDDPTTEDPLPTVTDYYLSGAEIVQGKEYLETGRQIKNNIVTIKVEPKKIVYFNMNTSRNPVKAVLPPLDPSMPKPPPGKIPVSVFTTSNYASGWKKYDIPLSALPLIAVAGERIGGAIIVGGVPSDQRLYFARDWSKSDWGAINAPKFQIKALAGRRSVGLVAVGGSSGKVVAWGDYNQWTEVAEAPFKPGGIAGSKVHGPIVFGGSDPRRVSYIDDYSSGLWREATKAPFAIEGLSGDKEYGVVAFGNAGKMVAYLRHLAGDWEPLPHLNKPVLRICGNASDGPAVMISGSRSIWMISDYGQPKWASVAPVPEEVSPIFMAGNRSDGVMVFCEV